MNTELKILSKVLVNSAEFAKCACVETGLNSKYLRELTLTPFIVTISPA